MNPLTVLPSYFDYLSKGGLEIMGTLAVAGLVLWYALGYRFVTIRRGTRADVRHLISAYERGSERRPQGIVDRAAALGVAIAQTRRTDLRRLLDDGFTEVERDLRRGRLAVRAIVTVAPLLGLLGTVMGMIETFGSLGDMSLFAASGGIAGGIAQALFTTQMGLSVAVPGVIVGRLLERRQSAIEDELAKVKDILCQKYAPREAQPA